MQGLIQSTILTLITHYKISLRIRQVLPKLNKLGHLRLTYQELFDSVIYKFVLFDNFDPLVQEADLFDTFDPLCQEADLSDTFGLLNISFVLFYLT